MIIRRLYLLKGLANKVQIVHTCMHMLEAWAHAMPIQIVLGKRGKEENLQYRLLEFIGLGLFSVVALYPLLDRDGLIRKKKVKD